MSEAAVVEPAPATPAPATPAATPAPTPAEPVANVDPAPAGPNPTPAANPNEPAPSEGDWRSQLAGGDEKRLKALERYADPAAYDKAFRDTQAALRDGGRVKIPGADATPEEMATACWLPTSRVYIGPSVVMPNPFCDAPLVAFCIATAGVLLLSSVGVTCVDTLSPWLALFCAPKAIGRVSVVGSYALPVRVVRH